MFPRLKSGRRETIKNKQTNNNNNKNRRKRKTVFLSKDILVKDILSKTNSSNDSVKQK